MAGDSDPLTDALGVLAGVLLAICLVPQLVKMYRSKSAADISYGWTAFYFLGLVAYFAYLFRLGALIGWIGIIVEAALVLLVVFGKFYLEHYYQPRRSAAAVAEEGKQLSLAAMEAPGDAAEAGDSELGNRGGGGGAGEEIAAAWHTGPSPSLQVPIPAPQHERVGLSRLSAAGTQQRAGAYRASSL